MKKHFNHGFTLLELMVVVAIIGILASIAIPAFTDQLSQSRRADAKTALLDLQQAQEKLRSSCNVYAADLDTTIVNGDGDPVPFLCTPGDSANTSLNFSQDSNEGWYTINITLATGIEFTATASAKAGGRQAGDAGCTTLTLTVDANSPNGDRTPADCW